MELSDLSLPGRPFVVSRDAPAPSLPAPLPAGPARLRRPRRSTVTPGNHAARPRGLDLRAHLARADVVVDEPVGLHAGTAGGGPTKVSPWRRSAITSVVGADVVADTSASVAGTGAGGGAFDRSRSPPPPSSPSPMASRPGGQGAAGGTGKTEMPVVSRMCCSRSGSSLTRLVGGIARPRAGGTEQADTGVDVFQVVPGPSSAGGRTRPR